MLICGLSFPWSSAHLQDVATTKQCHYVHAIPQLGHLVLIIIVHETWCGCAQNDAQREGIVARVAPSLTIHSGTHILSQE